MTIQSWGYGSPKGVVPGLSWARMLSFGGGKQNWCENESSVKVSAVSGGTREVSISTGFFGGYGILDFNDAPAVLQLPSVVSGTNYFMVCARRTWATKTTDFYFIDAGTVGLTTLPTRPWYSSGVDAQPLAMVAVAAGSLTPVVSADLRLMGTESGCYQAMSELVLQYATWLGAQIRIGGRLWRRVLNPAGTGRVWEQDVASELIGSVAGFPAAAAGVTTATVVVDRLVVPEFSYPRSADMATNCYVLTDHDNTVMEILLTANGAVIGRGRRTPGAGNPDTLYATGDHTVPANTAVTFEARVSRFSGTGKFSTSISGSLTNTNLRVSRAA